MSNGTKAASAAMQILRRRRPRSGAISKPPRTPSCSISSTSANSSGARASAATVSWELSGSMILAKNARPAKSIDKPSWAELQNLFATSALPMVGFGFMDNFIMIQAGGYIDSTLGVKFGLTTLTAAAMGQVVSDVSGVLCGSTVDSAITRLGLVKPNNMSPAKRRLRLSKRVSLAGAVVGVILGCGLGATSLWFVSHHNHEDQRNVDKTRGILSNMLQNAGVGCNDCTMFVMESRRWTSDRIKALCGADNEVPSKSDQMDVRLREMGDSDEETALHQQCAQNTTIVLSDGMMCAPIVGRNNSLLGVLQFVNNHPSNPHETRFDDKDVQLALITARHVGVVLDHCF